MQADDYDALVSSIYASSYRAGGWDVALERLRGAFGLDAFALMRLPDRFADGGSPDLMSVGGSHVTPSAAQKYDDYYGAIDPRVQVVRRRSVNDVFLCERYFDAAYVARNEFYQDFLRPEGLRFCMGTCIRLPDGTDFALGLLRGEDRGSYDAEVQRTFKRLIGHVGQALLAQERLAQPREQAAAMAVTDAASWGLIALGVDGRFLGGNALGDTLLADARLVKIRSGALVFSHAATQSRFAAAAARCLNGGRGETFLVHSTDAGARRLTMTLQPVPSDPADRASLPGPARAPGARLVGILAPLDSRRIPSMRQLMDVFDLAPAEARLARALASGETLDGYAAANALAISTVRTQMRAVLRKTGTERQAQAVRVLNNIPALRSRSV